MRVFGGVYMFRLQPMLVSVCAGVWSGLFCNRGIGAKWPDALNGQGMVGNPWSMRIDLQDGHFILTSAKPDDASSKATIPA